MARLQLALNVSDLREAVTFYTKFFGIEPAKVRSGYANFAIDEPPLKLVLIEGVGQPGALNHLGVEVFASHEVAEAADRLAAVGLETAVEEETLCCFALQNKVWVDGPDGVPWETYVVLEDVADPEALIGGAGCCVKDSRDESELAANVACC